MAPAYVSAAVDGCDAVQAAGADGDRDRRFQLGRDLELAHLDLEGVSHDVTVLVPAYTEHRLGLPVGLAAEEAPSLGLARTPRRGGSRVAALLLGLARTPSAVMSTQLLFLMLQGVNKVIPPAVGLSCGELSVDHIF